MPASMNNRYRHQILVAIFTTLCYLVINIKPALSEENSNSDSPPNSSNASLLKVNPTIRQICGGICLYGNINSAAIIEDGIHESGFQATVGFIWQLTSPEQKNTEIKSRMTDAQISKIQDEQNTIWMEKLVAAIRERDFSAANGFAILLAPKLGKTPEKLLDEIIGLLL